MNEAISRRHFVGRLGKAVAAAAVAEGGAKQRVAAGQSSQAGQNEQQPHFETRGVVLVPEDLTWKAWPERAKQAGLTTIALHHGASLPVVSSFMRSEIGHRFLEDCGRFGVRVEYELHAIRDLLPRELFGRNPELFRMNDQGQRVSDSNLCVHSERALEIVAENAVAMAKFLRPETNRYFFWGDDAKPWCHCEKCRGYSDSEQALILENHLIAQLRKVDAKAQLAHLAYASTIKAPHQIKPAAGIFLEYAPIRRRYDIPYARQRGAEFADNLELLDANLAVFGVKGAQVLEYWLDVSRFSKWKKPAVKLPWSGEIFSQDLDTYGSRGIRHATTFAVYIDSDYIEKFGEPPLQDYGRRLLRWAPRSTR